MASVVVVLAAVAAPIIRRSWSEPETPAPELGPIDASNHIACVVVAQKLISKTLKSPSTATFAPFLEWTFEKIDDHTTRMHGWVDSQNSYAAIIRGNFTAILSTNDDLWKLEYLAFEGSDDEYGHFRRTPDEQAEADRQAHLSELQRQRKQAEADKRDAVRRTEEQYAATTAAERAEWSRIYQEEERKRLESVTEDQKNLAAEAKEVRERERINAKFRAVYRLWKCLGGKATSAARISEYGAGYVTLEKHNGKKSRFKIADLPKPDREYVESVTEDLHR